ncbi:hypothetical protein ACLOJK_008379 [Asimina triloba]
MKAEREDENGNEGNVAQQCEDENDREQNKSRDHDIGLNASVVEGQVAKNFGR